ncbi:MAG: hypothetical protein K6T72_06150 [Anoxybacillus sp.]|nr:hypothetical protein [Anoxybacillus sp.]MCL6586096.1 hypothetical protein [Anoxybacillus sp.]
MNQWNPYMNRPYDEGYDVDEMMRHHDNNAPALPMMPTAQMPTMHSHSSPCGCHSMPMWDGMYPMGEMGAPGMMPPSAGMPMMPGTMTPAYPYPMQGAPMQPTGQMTPYGPGYYGMPPFPYGYYPQR